MPKKEEEQVLTPGGMRPKSAVHRVEHGQMVMGAGMVAASSDQPAGMAAPGLMAAAAGSVAEGGDEHVLTPGGYRHKSLVHHIEPGHLLDLSSGNIRKMHISGYEVTDFGPLPIRAGPEPLMPSNVARHPTKIPAIGEGWITYAYWTNNTGNPVSRFASIVSLAGFYSASDQIEHIVVGLANGRLCELWVKPNI